MGRQGLTTCGADGGRTGVDTFSFGAAYLGSSYTPFTFGGDPTQANFKIENLGVDKAVADRLDDRVKLLGAFDNLRRGMEKNQMMPLLFSEDDLEAMAAAKRAFNPDGRLNPAKVFPTGKMCGEIRVQPLPVVSAAS